MIRWSKDIKGKQEVENDSVEQILLTITAKKHSHKEVQRNVAKSVDFSSSIVEVPSADYFSKFVWGSIDI